MRTDYLLPQFHGLRLALSPIRFHLLRCVSTEFRVLAPTIFGVHLLLSSSSTDIGVSSSSIRFHFPRSLALELPPASVALAPPFLPCACLVCTRTLGVCHHSFFRYSFTMIFPSPALLNSLMAPGSGEDGWHGASVSPHTTENIKITKSCLVYGYRVEFRKGAQSSGPLKSTQKSEFQVKSG